MATLTEWSAYRRYRHWNWNIPAVAGGGDGRQQGIDMFIKEIAKIKMLVKLKTMWTPTILSSRNSIQFLVKMPLAKQPFPQYTQDTTGITLKKRLARPRASCAKNRT
jgi:hypothetical protein